MTAPRHTLWGVVTLGTLAGVLWLSAWVAFVLFLSHI